MNFLCFFVIVDKCKKYVLNLCFVKKKIDIRIIHVNMAYPYLTLFACCISIHLISLTKMVMWQNVPFPMKYPLEFATLIPLFMMRLPY